MLLKRITISGFKSFGDKVDFEFGPGVTCIVGPNGCGKSNVLDAFKWVLGEQSARSLRGRQMSDMIFNGSSVRRSSSVAQVDLMFDNADRTLPLDQDEVTVTRKLYRSGESEYQINGDVCRLKDIRELFMDTGVGVDAYSVVEQGRVDGLLQSNPQERRIIFEEAAGISKYKARRREAERKLDRTEHNLLRVSDVIDELQRRVRSVKLAAAKARKFQEYETSLDELRSGFALAEYHRFTGEIDGLAREARERGDRVTGVRTEIDRHEADEAELTSGLDRLAEEINAADSGFIQARSELLAQEERIEAAGKRTEEQRALLERTRQRHGADTRRVEDARGELAAAEQSVVALDDEMKSLGGRLAQLTEQDRSLARESAEAHSGLNDEKAGIIELLRRGARMHNEIVRLNTHREGLLGRKGRLSERDALVGVELSATLEKKAQSEHRAREIDELIGDQTRTLEEKEGEAASHAAYRQRLAAELGKAREDRTAMQSRRELLADLESRMEGVGAAARRLLDQRRLPDAPVELQALVGLVADLFETDVEHARVIEAALGDAAQHLVVTNGDALRGVDGPFTDLPDRLTLLCQDRLPPIVHDRDFSDQHGYVARAIDFVRYTDDLDHLARHLFDKTIVVESLDAAFAMAASDVSGHRFVTLDGRIVEPDGRVTIGAVSAATGLISRKSELRDLEERTDEIDEAIRSLDDQLTRADAEAEHLVGVQRRLRTALQEATSSSAEAKAALQGVVTTIARLTHEQPVIAQEVALIEQQIHEALQRSEEEGRSLEAVERENAEREERIEKRQAEIDRLAESRRDLQEQLTQARVAVGQLSEKRTAVAETIIALRRTLDDLNQAITTATHDMEQCETRIVEAREAAEQGRRRLGEMAGRIQTLEQRCQELRRSRDELRERSEQLTQAVKAARDRLEAAEAEHHTVEMSLTETRVHREDLVRRVCEELGIDLAGRYADYEHEDRDWTAVQTQIAELRRKMQRLGNVNLDAIQELEELETRERFLTGQRDDLTESRRQLDQLINQLNDESRERFRAAFTKIRDHFRSLFRKLFGGGRADIILENPDDVLESGIEILAQPPGKELQTISLMSGGEKSLTAIALLMSIFSIRPAPFAIMDEVDAALDEANNDRFNRIIQEFVSHAQFLIITHSKWTMNVADRLYGVTMQEPGVSTRVSVEFKGVSAA